MQNAIFCGSPRSHGNSDFATKLLLKTLGNGEIFNIAKAHIHGCLACDYCKEHVGECILSVNAQRLESKSKDTAHFYFNKLFCADQVFFVSPIYHYNVPAQLKAFLDRTQAWYYKNQYDIKHTYQSMPHKNQANGFQLNKKCCLILLAARKQGDKLFEGATLTFKYALKSLGYSLAEPLYLYNLEEKNALEKNLEYQSKIIQYAKNYHSLPLL